MSAGEFLGGARECRAWHQGDEWCHHHAKGLHLGVDERCESEDDERAHDRGQRRHKGQEVRAPSGQYQQETHEQAEDGGHDHAPHTDAEDEREAGRCQGVAEHRCPRGETGLLVGKRIEDACAFTWLNGSAPCLGRNLVHLGGLIEPQRREGSFRRHACSPDDRVIEQHDPGEHGHAEVGPVVRAGHGIERRRDIVDGVSGSEL